MAGKRQPFEISEVTRRAFEALKAIRQGDTLGYSALAQVMGCDPQAEGRHNVTSACRMLQRKPLERVYLCVPGEGVRWLTALDVARLGPHGIRRTHRMARRWARRMDTLQREDPSLSEADRQRHAQHLTLLGFLGQQSAGYAPPKGEVPANAAAPRPINLNDLRGL